jgi:TRAP-type C4-dicarboxylate transport system permease small subunit
MGRALTAISILLDRFGSFVVLPMLAALITLDVVLRYGFNAPLSWGLEASRHILLVFFLFGLLESFRVGEHVSMELISAKFPRTALRAVSLLQALLMVVIFYFIIKKVIEEIPFLYSLPQVTPELQLRVWVFYAFIALMASLTVLYVVHAAVMIATGRRDRVEEIERQSWAE